MNVKRKKSLEMKPQYIVLKPFKQFETWPAFHLIKGTLWFDAYSRVRHSCISTLLLFIALKKIIKKSECLTRSCVKRHMVRGVFIKLQNTDGRCYSWYIGRKESISLRRFILKERYFKCYRLTMQAFVFCQFTK